MKVNGRSKRNEKKIHWKTIKWFKWLGRLYLKLINEIFELNLSMRDFQICLKTLADIAFFIFLGESAKSLDNLKKTNYKTD